MIQLLLSILIFKRMGLGWYLEDDTMNIAIKNTNLKKESFTKEMKNKIVCIVGLGYVGLPLAKAFSKHLKVIGYDINEEKIKYLKNDNNEDNLDFTSDAARIKQADFVLICVPTPVTKSNPKSQT